MPDIFGVDLAGIINEAFSPLVFDQVLTKSVTTRDPADSTKTVSVSTDYPCKGFVDVYVDKWVAGTTVKVDDHKIVILGDSLPVGIVPEPGNKITAEGRVYIIVKDGVARDPAAATYECQSK